VFAKAAPTKEDLARVEQNTAQIEDVRATIASVDSRLKKQEDTEALRIRASRVSITVMGNQAGNAPYPLELFIKQTEEKNVSLTHLELYNEHGNAFGSFPCTHTGHPDGLHFQANIPLATMADWYRSGTPVQTVNRMRLKLKVWMTMNGIEVPRDMAVTVMETTGGMTGYMLNGSV
jgi:hypothetical protein